MNDDLKAYWEVVAHQINNTTASILLETSTLQLLIKKLGSPREPFARAMTSLEISVEIIGACLEEMETILAHPDKEPLPEAAAWEKDFHQRLNRLRERANQQNP